MNKFVKYWIIGACVTIVLSFFTDMTGYRRWSFDGDTMTLTEILHGEFIYYIFKGIIFGLAFSAIRKLFYIVNSYMVYKTVKSEPFSKDEIEILELKKKYESKN